jgi:hypothetical protein
MQQAQAVSKPQRPYTPAAAGAMITGAYRRMAENRLT